MSDFVQDMTIDNTSTTPAPAAVDRSNTLPAVVSGLAAFRFTVSLDAVLYALFVVFGTALRLINLSGIVLNDAEAHEALAAFRAIMPQAAGSVLVSHQPLAFAFNTLIMAVGGANNLTARLATVLISIVLILMPILFRRWLGRVGALIASGLLTMSSVLLVSARTMSGPVWSIALALGAVWLIARFVETRRATYAIMATVFLALTAIGAESAGFLVVIMLVGGLIFALLTNNPAEEVNESADDDLNEPFETEKAENSGVVVFRNVVRAWPWLRGLGASGLALAVIGSVFFLYPQGLSAFGDTLSHGIQGFLYRPIENPTAFPLLASLIYEPVLWVFGLIGVWLILRETVSFIQRALIGWLIVAVLACLIYPGAGAEHALWLTVPLVGLAAYSIERIVSPVVDRFWQVPTWGPWLHGVGMLATLCITGINLLMVGRAALNTMPALIPALDQPFRLVMIGLTIALTVILFFLSGSVWGGRAAWHGTGIGVLFFLGAYSLSGGWHVAVVNADDPREFWRTQAVSQNLTLLDSALTEASLRASGMRDTMPVTVVGTDDNALAWVLRRFYKTTFIMQPSAGTNTPVVLIPTDNAKPTLGAAYVGEPFALYNTWDRSTVQYWDMVPWLYEQNTRVEPTAGQKVTLWVRSDVYGVPKDASSANLSVPVAPVPRPGQP
jgi:uncharacterized protein (TIGR03663 family)